MTDAQIIAIRDECLPSQGEEPAKDAEART